MIVPLDITYGRGKRHAAVFTPSQWIAIKEQLNPTYKLRFEYLLQTAMRISEAVYVSKHPECFRVENGAIFLPQVEGMGKVECKLKCRQVMLTPAGVESVKKIYSESVTFPAYQNMEEVFKRAAKDADIDTRYVTTKCFRKTMVSWLMACYPERQEQIAHSAGHDYATMRAHYLTYGWRKDDISDMRSYVKDWGEAV
jgi:integrase